MPKSAVLQAKIREAKEKSISAIEKCRELVNRTEAENREMSADERRQFSAWEEEVKSHKATMSALNKDSQSLDWLEQAEQELDSPIDPLPNNQGDRLPSGKKKKPITVEWNPTDHYSPQFRSRHGRRIVEVGERSSDKYNDAFNIALDGGTPRAFAKAGISSNLYLPQNAVPMRTDDERRGGYFVASEQFVTELLKEVDDEVMIQQMARVFMIRQAQNLGVTKRTSKFSAWNWGSEIHDVTDHLDESLMYGRKFLHPHYITGSARISQDLLRSSTMPVQQMVLEEANINLAEVLEQAYLYAHGGGRPLGVMVPSTKGISTARDEAVVAGDILSGQSVETDFGFNTFIRAKYNLKNKYRRRARWMMHRNHIAKVATIKDNDGQYIWQPSKVVGDPDTILGLALDESEWMPDTAATDTYFAILADWSFYWIAIGLDLEVQRLDEIEARKNQVEYLMRMKIDAMPMLEEAFCRLIFG